MDALFGRQVHPVLKEREHAPLSVAVCPRHRGGDVQNMATSTVFTTVRARWPRIEVSPSSCFQPSYRSAFTPP